MDFDILKIHEIINLQGFIYTWKLQVYKWSNNVYKSLPCITVQVYKWSNVMYMCNVRLQFEFISVLLCAVI